MGVFISRLVAKCITPPLLFFNTVLRRLFPMQIEEMASLVARTGRQLQRSEKGCRQVVGCIPYRYKETNQSSSPDNKFLKEIEVLVISSQKKKEMLFPKGGWEIGESMEDAALRETLEEAGVVGSLEGKLGKWRYRSKHNGIDHEGYMFPLLVKKQLELWPERNNRQRKWMTAAEAREVCQQGWMKEALDVFVNRHTLIQPDKEADTAPLAA